MREAGPESNVEVIAHRVLNPHQVAGHVAELHTVLEPHVGLKPIAVTAHVHSTRSQHTVTQGHSRKREPMNMKHRAYAI